jgi:methyl-accepting chemotaxis protein
MTTSGSYSLQRTMIIYMLLIGCAALLVASEFVWDTHLITVQQELRQGIQSPISGKLDEDRINSSLVKIRNKAMMMVGVILAVVVIVLTMFIKNITEPLQHMIEVSKAISAGDLRQTTGIKTRSELSQLSAAIDDMSTNLQEIIMLSRSVCDSANRVVGNTMQLMKKEAIFTPSSQEIIQQLDRLESELAMLGQVIDFFKLYSVDDRP